MPLSTKAALETLHRAKILPELEPFDHRLETAAVKMMRSPMWLQAPTCIPNEPRGAKWTHRGWYQLANQVRGEFDAR